MSNPVWLFLHHIRPYLFEVETLDPKNLKSVAAALNLVDRFNQISEHALHEHFSTVDPSANDSEELRMFHNLLKQLLVVMPRHPELTATYNKVFGVYVMLFEHQHDEYGKRGAERIVEMLKPENFQHNIEAWPIYHKAIILAVWAFVRRAKTTLSPHNDDTIPLKIAAVELVLRTIDPDMSAAAKMRRMSEYGLDHTYRLYQFHHHESASTTPQ